MATSANNPPSIINTDALTATLKNAQGDEELFAAIVNAPFQDAISAASIFLGIVVLLLVNKDDNTIDRIALSNTEMADRSKQMSMKKFEDIRIPLDHKENILAKAIATGQPQLTTDWKYLFMPELSAQDARLNQADAGISFSCARPLMARDGGALIFSYFQPQELIEGDCEGFMKLYTALVDTRLAS